MSVRQSTLMTPLLAMAVWGCAPSVQLAVPQTVSSDDWSMALPATELNRARPVAIGQAIGSPQLEQLLQTAQHQNMQIAIAGARIQQARGLLRTARSAMLPAVNAAANLSSSRDRQLGNTLAFDGAFVEADISFGLDIWGQNRARNRAAAARVQSDIFRQSVAQLIVETEVVRSYVRGCTLTERLRIIDQNIARAEELERIVRARFNVGEASRVDLGLQTIQNRQLRAERLRLVDALGRTRTALAVLLGEEAPQFSIDFGRLSDLHVPQLARLQPADLLARRPDLRAAEFDLSAANADVGAARAAFMPQIDLNARNFVQAAGLGSPLSIGSSLSMNILAPIFGRGRLRGDLAVASGRQVELANTYRQAVLVALAETENAIAANDLASQRKTLIDGMLSEARLTARLSRLQYVNGDADIQALLSAQNFLSTAEDANILAMQEQIEAAIDFYLAVGGAAIVE